MLRIAIAAAACALLLPAQALGAAGHVVISQVYGGGGNSSAVYTNDFVELYNPTTAPVSIDGWSIQYASATGTGNFGANSGQLTPLGGTIQPGHYLLVQEAAGTTPALPLPTPDLTDSSPINISGSGGKVALVSDAVSLGCNGGSTPCSPAQLARIVDLVGWDGANFSEGAPAPQTQNWTAVIRAGGGCTDTDSNADDFGVGTPTPRNAFAPAHSCLGVSISCGSGITTPAGVSASTDVTATDADGRVVAIDLSSPDPAISRTGFTPAAGIGGTATAEVTADSTLPVGDYTAHLEAANDDDPPQTAGCDLAVHVLPILPIGVVQGSVPDSADGSTFPSPYVGQTVTIRGVVTEKTAEGGNGFFIQNTAATADGDPTSSDGIFVYLGGFTTLIGGYTPVVGDEIVMSGRVSEYYNQTELGTARFVELEGHGVVVAPFAANPPVSAADAARYWERHEGELGALPAGSTVDSPVHLYASTGDTEFYALSPDSPVSTRTDLYARRAFRAAHPLGGAGASRVLITDEGIKALFGPGVRLVPVHTFQTFTAPVQGGVSYSFSKYSLSVDAQPQLANGVDPYVNAPPAVFDRGKAYSVANYNVENLYDYRDDPTDGCDFAGNAGCPGVSPPFDYVPASAAEYQSRLTEIAHQVVEGLHSPDVIAVAEAEDQDICAVAGGTLDCTASDGKPDVLQELATRIAALGGPAYDAAFDRDGADSRGIISAFMYRTDRVQLLPAFAAPAIDYRGAPLPYDGDVSNPLALNAVLPADVDRSTGVDGSNVFTRAPEVAHFRVWRTEVGLSEFRDLWVVANHFSSGPDTRVGQRREQAAYNAAIVQAIEADDPAARIDVAGDLNVYPRPDDPFDPPSDQLAPLYDAGLHNLFDTAVAQHPSSAYSYVYEGQAQTLDQQFVSPALFADLKAVNEAHVNSDWTPEVADDGNRGTSDHDPMVSRFDGRATLAGLRQLVLFYAATGKLNDHAEKGLLDRLDRAASFQASGQENPYANQLHSFAQDATHGVPGEIDPAAGDALAAEAAAVLG